jgi:hypothetical protein
VSFSVEEEDYLATCILRIFRSIVSELESIKYSPLTSGSSENRVYAIVWSAVLPPSRGCKPSEDSTIAISSNTPPYSRMRRETRGERNAILDPGALFSRILVSGVIRRYILAVPALPLVHNHPCPYPYPFPTQTPTHP